MKTDRLLDWEENEVIQTGSDKGKAVAQPREEEFDPSVSDMDYLIARCRYHGDPIS